MYRKMIVYDRETRDFAIYLNGELVGYAPTYFDAKNQLNTLVYELLSRPGFRAPGAPLMAADSAAPESADELPAGTPPGDTAQDSAA